jgi:hypothetical protein
VGAESPINLGRYSWDASLAVDGEFAVVEGHGGGLALCSLGSSLRGVLRACLILFDGLKDSTAQRQLKGYLRYS